MAKAFHGRIEDTLDALIILEACRQGVLPKINRRLLAAERGEVQDNTIVKSEDDDIPVPSKLSAVTPPMTSTSPFPGESQSSAHIPLSSEVVNLPSPSLITPGSVFVFDEEESKICRWTDGRIWSPSRICGNFLVYRELFRKLSNEKCLTPKEKAKMKNGSGLKDKALKERIEKDNLVVMGCMKGTFVLKKDGLVKKTICVKGVNLPSPQELSTRTYRGRGRMNKRKSEIPPPGFSEAGIQHLVCYEKPGAMENLHRPREYVELLNLPLSRTFIMMQKYRNPIRILRLAPGAQSIEPFDEYVSSNRVVEGRASEDDASSEKDSKPRTKRKNAHRGECKEKDDDEGFGNTSDDGGSSSDGFTEDSVHPRKRTGSIVYLNHSYPTRGQRRQARNVEQHRLERQCLVTSPASRTKKPLSDFTAYAHDVLPKKSTMQGESAENQLNDRFQDTGLIDDKRDALRDTIRLTTTSGAHRQRPVTTIQFELASV
ncbi:hypothetical protein BGX34_006187 [Mortierella sp. NVP85]|nr:hypothetical protein BGX34_006187 [Mortierella sp. NVP85]